MHNADQNLETILNWGWYDAFYDPDISCDFRDEIIEGVFTSKNKIQTALQALGLSYLPFGRNGDNECFSVEHFDENLLPKDESDNDENNENKNPLEDENREIKLIEDQTYTVGGRVYPATGAYYRFAVNRRGGAMFAQALKKPQVASKENLESNIPEDQMPQLQRASDIMWSYWERNNPSPQNLRYYFVNYVRNEETTPLIARALKNHKMDKVPRWPRLELGMDSEEAEAILGQFKRVAALLETLANIDWLANGLDNRPLPLPAQGHPGREELRRHHDLQGQLPRGLATRSTAAVQDY